jgi:hypothetical protein
VLLSGIKNAPTRLLVLAKACASDMKKSFELDAPLRRGFSLVVILLLAGT